jgi:hypothetical protein
MPPLAKISLGFKAVVLAEGMAGRLDVESKVGRQVAGLERESEAGSTHGTSERTPDEQTEKYLCLLKSGGSKTR